MSLSYYTLTLQSLAAESSENTFLVCKSPEGIGQIVAQEVEGWRGKQWVGVREEAYIYSFKPNGGRTRTSEPQEGYLAICDRNNRLHSERVISTKQIMDNDAKAVLELLGVRNGNS